MNIQLRISVRIQGKMTHIVFGSDALYNSMRHSVLFAYEGAEKMRNGESLNEILLNILGVNYFTKILKK